ncbi:2-(3-amino-3-carboxypropyl)histidine synthase subunit 2 isoform X2 [Halyomorpha halys]|uniref:2-(3-amino-3-carboxypropyl)histidine synthase subunit 2 isoform X2 n=1 Tax=Halyomorpha halys TaxID=286706 RepID=UPI0006D5121C|nr:2-(3-amino-3-carboxypropyl)histidine synthase subunit 2 isoform X2 [Halyomorpha halys]
MSVVEQDFILDDDEDRNIPLKDRFEIQNCVDWIKTYSYSKVCLQFPDTFLSESVDVALHIEEQISNKTYILGDTTYGSCCVDEIAAQHIGGDAIIHFGHSCLTSSPQIPVLNIFPKRKMDFSALRSLISEMNGSIVVIYDVGYHHLLGEIQACFLEKEAIIPEILLGSKHNKDCSTHCKVKETGEHSEVRFSRGYCLPEVTPKNLIYIGDKTDACFKNFLYLFKGAEIWNCSFKSGVEKYNILNAYKHISYLVEEIKAAESLTVVVVTLTMKGYLEAIDHVKMLAKKWNKKVYVISVGKPTIAKLTNFPEMEVFVVVGCTELELPSRRELIQPVVGLLEVELALNNSRTWDDTLTRDFRDLILGGQNYIPVKEIEVTSDVSLITGKMNKLSNDSAGDSTELAINQEKALASSSQKIGGKQEKTWFGLERMIGETPVTLAVKGRHGTSTGYEEEPTVDKN